MLKFKVTTCKSCGAECRTGKRGLCDKCYNLKIKETSKLNKKKEKERLKRQSEVSITALDNVFSKLVRNIYPEFCHSCLLPLDRTGLQCCHFISRKIYAFRWDIRNCLPGCMQCNFYRQHHVYELGLWINKYNHKTTADSISKIATAGNIGLKLSKKDRKTLYDIYSDYLKRSTDVGQNQKRLLREELITELLNKNLIINL